MENDLHLHPETDQEKKDARALTDPRQAKNLATNRGVRFYVEGQLNSLEDTMMRTMGDGFAALSESMRQMNEAAEDANRVIADLKMRLEVLEVRWYERLMQDFEWDWLSFRAWLFKRFKIGTDPDAVEKEEDRLTDYAEAITDMKATVREMKPVEATILDEEDLHKCLCGHPEFTHSFDGDGPCQEAGCNCDAYESVREG